MYSIPGVHFMIKMLQIEPIARPYLLQSVKDHAWILLLHSICVKMASMVGCRWVGRQVQPHGTDWGGGNRSAERTRADDIQGAGNHCAECPADQYMGLECDIHQRPEPKDDLQSSLIQVRHCLSQFLSIRSGICLNEFLSTTLPPNWLEIWFPFKVALNAKIVQRLSSHS